MSDSVCLSPDTWAERNFGNAPLKDLRRRRRAVTIATAMAQHPGKSIPQLFARPSDIKAAYAFFDREEVKPDLLQTPHRKATLDKCRERKATILFPEDTTTMSFTGREPIPGLGPVGDETTKGQQGFLLHSVLAMGWKHPGERVEQWCKREPLEVIGLADQQIHVRPEETRRKRTGKKSSPRREGETDLESKFWIDSTERIGPGPVAADARWVRVCDREADIYEAILGFVEAGHGYVVRSRCDRVVLDPETGEREGLLFERVKRTRSLGAFDLHLRARPNQEARTAHLSVSATALLAGSPDRPGCPRGKGTPLSFTAVRVWESDPPAGEEGLEWVLLTDAAVRLFEEGLEVALQYSARWLVEEYHKGLKTGMGAEDLQLETAARLMAAVSMMGVTALRLLRIKEGCRLMAAVSASESGLSEDELEVLAAETGRKLRTVGDVALALGRMGGHMNRKGDGMPGWITLWRGYDKLMYMTAGFILAKKLKKSRE